MEEEKKPTRYYVLQVKWPSLQTDRLQTYKCCRPWWPIARYGISSKSLAWKKCYIWQIKVLFTIDWSRPNIQVFQATFVAWYTWSFRKIPCTNTPSFTPIQKKTGEITVLYILTFIFLDNKSFFSLMAGTLIIYHWPMRPIKTEY